MTSMTSVHQPVRGGRKKPRRGCDWPPERPIQDVNEMSMKWNIWNREQPKTTQHVDRSKIPRFSVPHNYHNFCPQSDMIYEISTGIWRASVFVCLGAQKIKLLSWIMLNPNHQLLSPISDRLPFVVHFEVSTPRNRSEMYFSLSASAEWNVLSQLLSKTCHEIFQAGERIMEGHLL